MRRLCQLRVVLTRICSGIEWCHRTICEESIVTESARFTAPQHFRGIVARDAACHRRRRHRHAASIIFSRSDTSSASARIVDSTRSSWILPLRRYRWAFRPDLLSAATVIPRRRPVIFENWSSVGSESHIQLVLDPTAANRIVDRYVAALQTCIQSLLNRYHSCWCSMAI